MTTTSLSTSKRIHELTGWDDTERYWFYEDSHPDLAEWELVTHDMSGKAIPAYSLAYLLERLPPGTHVIRKSEGAAASVAANTHTKYHKDYISADTPTEAAGLLVIALAEAGLLPKGGEG
jgi:hypothetical protein